MSRPYIYAAAAILLTGIVAVLRSVEAAETDTKLFALLVQIERAEDAKALSMVIRETTRSPDFSMVEADVIAGESTTSLLYLARGFCGLIHSRGWTVALIEQVSEHPVVYRLAVPTSEHLEGGPGLPRMILSESECARIEHGSLH